MADSEFDSSIISLNEKNARDFADRSIKGVLSHRVLLDQLLKNALPHDLYLRLDCPQAQPQKTDFIDPRWRKRFADVFWLVPWRDQPDPGSVLVAVLIEHQSQPDPTMPLRLLIYVVRFWERQLKLWEDQPIPRKGLRLAAPLPCVFYTGGRPWTEPRSLRELLKVPELLERFVPDWDSIFFELRDYDLEKLRQSEDELLKVLAIPRGERAKFDVFLPLVRDAATSLLKTAKLNKVERHELLELILNWTQHRRTKSEFETIAGELDELFQNSPETKAVLKTHKRSAVAHYQKLGFDKGFGEGETSGFAKGETSGFAKGKREGELEAMRRVLRRSLEGKFRAIDQTARTKIEQCEDAARIESAIERVSQLSSLDELDLG